MSYPNFLSGVPLTCKLWKLVSFEHPLHMDNGNFSLAYHFCHIPHVPGNLSSWRRNYQYNANSQAEMKYNINMSN